MRHYILNTIKELELFVTPAGEKIKTLAADMDKSGGLDTYSYHISKMRKGCLLCVLRVQICRCGMRYKVDVNCWSDFIFFGLGVFDIFLNQIHFNFKKISPKENIAKNDIYLIYLRFKTQKA